MIRFFYFIWRSIKFFLKLILALVIVAIILYIGIIYYFKPSNDRIWSPDMVVLPQVMIEDNLATIKNIRDITYTDKTDYQVKHYNDTFDLDKIKAVYLYTDPFGKLSAHAMMGFEFLDGKKVILSVEIRKEVNETFSGVLGLLRQYELMYVWATESDVIKLRTNFRNDNVYMYELDMAPENMAKLFIEAAKRTNELYDQPEMYNTLFNNCTSNLIKQLQIVYDQKIIWDWRYFAPAYAEQLGINFGLITNGQTIEEVRKNSRLEKF